MTPAKHVMIDTETLGTTPGCVVLTVGATVFDPFLHPDDPTDVPAPGETFETGISLEDSLARGLAIEAGTLRFWMTEADDAARREAFSGTAPLAEALEGLSAWLSGLGEFRLWGHGATFDPPVLAAAYRAAGIPLPWDFRSVRDTRTAFEMAGVEYRGRHHRVIEDCLGQAHAVRKAYATLGLRR